MVGLSIVLESSSSSSRKASSSNRNYPQVINKSTMIKPSPPTPPPPHLRWNSTAAGFLNHCFFCFQKLSPSKDIYMYKGDRAFCSEDCRGRQIVMDEEEMFNNSTPIYQRDHCSLVAMKDQSSSSSSSSSSSRNRRGKNRANGFVY